VASPQGAGMSQETKCCKHCGEVLPLSDFYRNSTGIMGRRPECKACFTANRKPKPNKGIKRGYTTREVSFIAANYDRLGPARCALELGRSYDSVKWKRWSIGQ